LWAHLLFVSARQAACDRLAVLSEVADWRSRVAPSRLAPRRDAISLDGVS
jgi:ribonuclease D